MCTTLVKPFHVEWYFHPSESTQRMPLYTGDVISDPFAEHFDVSLISSDNLSAKYNLTIKSANSSHGGKYECLDGSGFGVSTYFNLTLLSEYFKNRKLIIVFFLINFMPIIGINYIL